MTEEQAKQKLIAWAEAQIGTKEGPNNWNKYAESADLQRLYGWKAQIQPWCDTIYDEGMIECFGLENASKMTYQPIGQGSAACKYSAAFYSAHGALMSYPEMGDQIFFYDSNGEINHTGVVEAVGGGIVYTIEGNKSDRVMRGSYATSSQSIAGYGRPKWSVVASENPNNGNQDATTPATPATPSTPTTEPVDTTVYCVVSARMPVIEYGDKGEYVKLMQQRLQIKGFNCGWYGADGDYGQCTKNALLKFQKEYGLEQDGICGKYSWAALLEVK